jgi:delta 1-pyrroline-5-carboxylate dehydrogenase
MLAARVEAGSVCVNDVISGVAVTDVPFGGVKESGSGRRHGVSGIRRFVTEQAIVTDRFGLSREVIWYPYSAGGERAMRKLLDVLFSRGILAKLRAIFSRKSR